MSRLATLLLALVAPAALAAEATSSSFPTSGFTRLAIDQGQGDVTIRASTKDVATVKAIRLNFDPDNCELRILVKDRTLTIINREASGLSLKEKHCEVDFEVEIPARIATDLNVGAGDVEIFGLKSDLVYRLGAGDLSIKDVDIKKLDGQSGTGKVDIEGILADATLKIGAGDAQITLPRAPGKGSIDLRMGTGDAVVSMPKESRVKAQFKSGVGSLTNELGDYKNANFTISGRAGVGDMTIKRL